MKQKQENNRKQWEPDKVKILIMVDMGLTIQANNKYTKTTNIHMHIHKQRTTETATIKDKIAKMKMLNLHILRSSFPIGTPTQESIVIRMGIITKITELVDLKDISFKIECMDLTILMNYPPTSSIDKDQLKPFNRKIVP